jgi:hypothetical protein
VSRRPGGTLALKRVSSAEDIALRAKPHPTLSETLRECAEAVYGHATHTLARRWAR